MESLSRLVRSGSVKDERKFAHAMRLLEETAGLANSISRMEENRSSYEVLSEEMKDNGDPGYLLEEGILKSGLALAAAVTYFHEYLREAYGLDDKDA